MGCVAPVYRPRDAEHTVLHQVVAEHLEAFLGAAAEAGDGASLPQFVEREFREFLTCGGYLPFFSGYAMASFLESHQIYRRDVKRFVLTQAYRLKDHARQMAAREGRPYQYFGERTKKEDLARQMAERDGITEGLVCVFATVEPCRTFSLRWREGSAFIQSAQRKCLILYYYFMDRDFGLIHVRRQTWFPLQLQVYVNGHEWLARKLAQHGVRYTKHDNAFLWLADCPRAQRLADRFVSLPWVARLDRYARQVNPLLRDGLTSMSYYWVTTQAEYATDLVFKSPQQLAEFFPRLLEHSTLYFSARDVLSFLGRKWHGKFAGEVVTDQFDHGFNPVARPDHQNLARRSQLMTRNSRVPRSAASSTVSTSTGWLRRSPARAAGASLPSGIGSWAPRSDSGNSTSPRSTLRPREQPREFHRKKQRTNDGRIYALRTEDLSGLHGGGIPGRRRAAEDEASSTTSQADIRGLLSSIVSKPVTCSDSL